MANQESVSESGAGQTPRGAALVAESPWFWMIVFTLMAQLVLLGVHRKYSARQSGIERRFEAREELMRRHAEGAGSMAGEELSAATPQPPMIPLWPLQLCFAIATAVSALLLSRQLRRPMAERSSP